MSAPYRTEAIILRRTNYGEADRVVSLLTPDRGKISGIAKGVRKPKSKLAGGLELLATCDVTIMGGRGNLGLITSARLNEFYGDILHDYDRMQFAYTMIQQVNKAAETVSEPEFYYLLRGGLQFLNMVDINWRITELWFRLHLQTLLGHGMNLAIDREGAKLAADTTYHFDFGENALFADGRGRFTAEHIKLLRLTTAKNPAVLKQVGGIGKIIEDCLWLLRTLET